MVISYTQLLSRRYKGHLDREADEFISFAADGANRMQLLIRGLLAYCDVGAKGKDDLLETSSGAALEQAVANLAKTINQAGAIITRDPLPTITADAPQLVQLFQNLLENAIKYRGADPPRVQVSAKKNGDSEWIFSVRDNGIGIDSQHFERIFVMYKRLHGRNERPAPKSACRCAKR